MTHEARILVMAMMAVCPAVLFAMPTQQELKKAQPLVAELMAPTMDDFKAKKKTAAEVADAAVKYAGEAETEAAKFMLYRSSIPYYVKGEAYDKAADAVEQMKANVKDVPPSVVEEIISKTTVRANKEKAPRLFELYQQAKTQAEAEKDVDEIRKKSASTTNRRKLAEALATAGNWSEALKEFASLRNDVALIAKKERDGNGKSYELGEFWWAYEPVYENAEDTFKIHAAAHYRKALAAGEITGLKKNIVEQRIAKYGNVSESCAAASTAVAKTTGPIELKMGGNSPFAVNGNVATLKLPNGEKIEFVKCPPGEFKMLADYVSYKTVDVKMARPFWISKTHMSIGQYQAVMNIPVDSATRTQRQNMTRVKEQKAGMFEKMNSDYCADLPAGYVIRYPSIAEWEYAYHANTRDSNDPYWHTRTFWTNDTFFDTIKPKNENVGSTVANKWGITDLRAKNILLDRFDEKELKYEEETDATVEKVVKILKPLQGTDPFYWTDCEDYICQEIGSSFEFRNKFSEKNEWTTWKDNFHLVIGPDLVSEWKAKQKATGAAAPAPMATTPSTGPIELKTGGNSPFTVNGNVAMLTLKSGVKLEFVKCPSGLVKVVDDYEKKSTRKVRITRPFWIMKRCLWKDDAKGVEQFRDSYCENGVQIHPAFSRIEGFCSDLTDDLKSVIPAGYVVRLPSIAEWEYAYLAGGEDPDDEPFGSLLRPHDWGLFNKHGGKTPVNKWGLCDFHVVEKVLDRVNPQTVNVFEKEADRVARLPASEQNDDLLYWGDDLDATAPLVRLAPWQKLRIAKDKAAAAVRLVIGPDLVSEWKAKNAKK